jgi:hypothetical protein
VKRFCFPKKILKFHESFQKIQKSLDIWIFGYFFFHNIFCMAELNENEADVAVPKNRYGMKVLRTRITSLNTKLDRAVEDIREAEERADSLREKIAKVTVAYETGERILRMKETKMEDLSEATTEVAMMSAAKSVVDLDRRVDEEKKKIVKLADPKEAALCEELMAFYNASKATKAKHATPRQQIRAGSQSPRSGRLSPVFKVRGSASPRHEEVEEDADVGDLALKLNDSNLEGSAPEKF